MCVAPVGMGLTRCQLCFTKTYSGIPCAVRGHVPTRGSAARAPPFGALGARRNARRIGAAENVANCVAVAPAFPPPRFPGGPAPQFGALGWRRNVPDPRCLATMARTWHWRRCSHRPAVARRRAREPGPRPSAGVGARYQAPERVEIEAARRWPRCGHSDGSVFPPPRLPGGAALKPRWEPGRFGALREWRNVAGSTLLLKTATTARSSEADGIDGHSGLRSRRAAWNTRGALSSYFLISARRGSHLCR
jgi:hypothetical protein